MTPEPQHPEETADGTSARQTWRHSAFVRRTVRGALGGAGGLLAGCAALAVAELVSAGVRPESGPVDVVGESVIDRTPPALKDYAVRHFGTNDKFMLELGILVILALFALSLGVLSLRLRRTAAAGVLLFGVVGAWAAAGRPTAQGADVLPSIVGAVLGAGVLYLLAGRLRAVPAPATGAGPPTAPLAAPAPASPAAPTPPAASAPASAPASSAPASPSPGTFDRRGFVVAAAATAVASSGAAVLGFELNAGAGAPAIASRNAIRLPVPRSRAGRVPAGADLRVDGLSPFMTPASAFYRVDTALVVPKIDARTWRLRIHGKGVQRELTLVFQDLLDRRLVERDITMTCVSNQVGGPYVGNARWIGVPLADLLKEAGVRAPSRGGPADQLVSRSVDGMTIGTPVETVLDGRDAMLAVGMNGEPLPFEHGFPVRMVVPGLYGYVSACKWLTDLELTTFDAYDAYWVKRSWSREAPVKTESRIDTPRPFAAPKAGTVRVAGVAWAQHRGIARVEVRADGGAWHAARLAAEDSADTWRQWVWDWPATPGSHTLEVRATDRTGLTQTKDRVGTVPNGATGWHSVFVTVG